MRIIDLIKAREEKNRKWDVGITICLSCGETMKTLVERGANPRTLECEKCHRCNSLFIDARVIRDTVDLSLELSEE